MSSMSAKILPAILRSLGYLPLPVLAGIGSLAGRVSYACRTRMARVTRRNIERCFPHWTQAQQRQLELESLRHTGRLAGEILKVWSQDFEWTRQRIAGVQGLDMVKEQLALGKGLIVLSPHLGNWEALGMYLTTFGPVTNLYEPPKRQEFENLVHHAREKSGAKLVPTNTRGVAALLQALKRGEISGILPDQTPNSAGGAFSEFFGLPTFTMTLIHKLVMRTGCRVVYGYAKRVSGGFEIVFQEVPEDLYCDDEALALRALNQGIENCVMNIPEQYQWEYKRFKRQPTNANFYEDMQ